MLTDVEVETSAKTVPPEPQETTTIVEVKESSSSSKPAPMTLDLGGDDIHPSSIFTAVLNKKIDRHASTSVNPPVAKTGGLLQFEGFVTGLKDMGLVSDGDTAILHRSQQQEPVNKGYSSQLQRANKSLKEKEEECVEATASKETAEKQVKKTKAKAKGKCKAKPKAKAKEQEQEQVHAPSPMKKKKKKGNKHKKQDNQTKRKATEEAQGAEADAQEPAAQETPEGFDTNTSRAVNRKRFTSRAWHAAFDKAQNDGLDAETSKERAREASQAASKEFERLWPTPKRSPKAKVKKVKKKKQTHEEESGHHENVD